MFEFIGIFGDVIRIVTFQQAPIRNGFAPHDRHRPREKTRAGSVPRVGRNAARATEAPIVG